MTAETCSVNKCQYKYSISVDVPSVKAHFDSLKHDMSNILKDQTSDIKSAFGEIVEAKTQRGGGMYRKAFPRVSGSPRLYVDNPVLSTHKT